MSEFSDPHPSDDVPEPPDEAHEAQPGTAPHANDEERAHDATRSNDPWGSASPGPRAQRAAWPTINSWRAPLVPASPLPTAPGAPVHVARVTGRPWMSIALVAALVGAVIGGSTAWIARPSPSTAQITIREGTALPGAAILASGTPIPRLVDAVSPSVVSVDVSTGFGDDEGSGMIISSDGLVVTNDHVVASYARAGEGQITVTRTGTSAALPATLLGTNQQFDVALLQIKNVTGLPAITFGKSDKLVVGDSVVAIGNALGLAAGTPTVTSGIVSALGRTVSASDTQTGASETLYGMIQTDAAINPGNSGGPLLDSSGQVVGMNTAVAGATSNGSNAQNIGFAIPSARIVSLIPSLISMHLPTTPSRHGGFLGVEITSTTTAKQGRPHVTIQSVLPGDPAKAAGIRAGDVIVSIQGRAMHTDADVASVMSTIKPGTKVTVVILRGGRQLSFEVVVIKVPPGA
jgi:S1-C subfamily serine protease